MKFHSDFIVNNENYDTDGMCGIISFDLPKTSGLSHGQILGMCSTSQDLGDSPIEKLKGKIIRVTVEVIGE